MKFTDIFVKRPVLAAVVSLLILLVGLNAMFSLPVRQYPELKNTVIKVTTSYPGAAPELMQGFITTPIAQAVASAEGIDYLTSSSTQGTSTVTAYIKLNSDPNAAMTDVMAKVNQVKYQIPREANDPVILKSTGETTAVMYIAFYSPELSGPAIDRAGRNEHGIVGEGSHGRRRARRPVAARPARRRGGRAGPRARGRQGEGLSRQGEGVVQVRELSRQVREPSR